MTYYSHSELERAIERSAKRQRENALVNEHLKDLEDLWEKRVALRCMLPDPKPFDRYFSVNCFVWLN